MLNGICHRLGFLASTKGELHMIYSYVDIRWRFRRDNEKLHWVCGIFKISLHCPRQCWLS